jgi:hypothetical protein
MINLNICMKNSFCFTPIILLFIAVNCFGQSADHLQKQYTLVNCIMSAGSDTGSVHLKDVQGAGIAWINHQKFTHGTIELDIKGKDVYMASFVGIAFNGVNDSTYEVIYFRPFNFRAADPLRKGHSVQYMALPKYDWQKLRQEYPGKYEQAISPAPDANIWFHARIIVDSKNIKIYINGNTAPSLVVEPLVQRDGEMIGLWEGGSEGDWKNLKITPNIN